MWGKRGGNPSTGKVGVKFTFLKPEKRWRGTSTFIVYGGEKRVWHVKRARQGGKRDSTCMRLLSCVGGGGARVTVKVGGGGNCVTKEKLEGNGA